MDPFTKQALADLKDLLREKVISLAEYRAEVTALHERARPAPAAAATVDDADYDETMALIEREKARNVRKPRARVEAEEPAPVTAADADYDETMALIKREKARNVRKPRDVAAPEVKADEVEKGGDLVYVNGEVTYQWSAWDWEIGAGRFFKISPQAFFKAIREQTIQRLNDDLAEHRD